ncbi:MAG TPA: glycosyl hydrolase family 28-related protein, partial [Candidatus Sulfotelmatobacter sp.]
MDQRGRRDFLRFSGAGIAAALPYGSANAQSASASHSAGIHDVRTFGAAGDGKTIDSSAINHAIDAAASAGGGTLLFPA